MPSRTATRSRFLLLLSASSIALALVVLVTKAHAEAPRQKPVATPSATPSPQPGPTRVQSRCIPTPWARAREGPVLLGDDVEIELGVRIRCSYWVAPSHVVLVLDGSAAMAGEPSRQIKDAARHVVNRIAPHSVRFGVVAFSDTARQLCPVSANAKQTLSCIGQVGASGGKRVDLGITEGVRVLGWAQRSVPLNDASEVLILMSDGRSDNGCAAAVRAAAQARGGDTRVMAYCPTGDCDDACLRQVASEPSLSFTRGRITQLIDEVNRSSPRVIRPYVRQVTVKERLADRVDLVPGSITPVPARPAKPYRWFQWLSHYTPTGPFPGGGARFFYRVTPLEPRRVPVSLGATGILTDSIGFTREWSFEIPHAWAVIPTATPKPTGTPTPVTPTSTNTPRPTRTPRFTPAPPLWYTHLPMAVRRR